MAVGVMAQSVEERYALYNGDAAEILAGIPDSSIDLIVTSPPFASLYTYSASERDLGNCRNESEFFEHFDFIIREMLRVLKPGRVAAIHVMDIPAMLSRDGYIGLKDFSGDVIRAFIPRGYVLDSKIPIDKNQQAQSIRTHSKHLTLMQFEKDRSWMAPALPDYILKFRKPGENAIPICGDMTRDEWIEWANPTWKNKAEFIEWAESESTAWPADDRCAGVGAAPTWYGIHENDTLNVAAARTAEAERHVCPLQLGTVERCIRLWSNRGEVVLDPFDGIGSVVYRGVQLHRRGVGLELNPAYHQCAARNIERAVAESEQKTLFDDLVPS